MSQSRNEKLLKARDDQMMGMFIPIFIPIPMVISTQGRVGAFGEPRGRRDRRCYKQPPRQPPAKQTKNYSQYHQSLMIFFILTTTKSLFLQLIHT